VLTRRAPFLAPGAVIECGGIRSGAPKSPSKGLPVRSFRLSQTPNETLLLVLKLVYDNNRIRTLEFWRKMSDGPEDEEEDWFRPVWETEDELDPPGAPPRARKPPTEPDYHHPLLTPLARAQDAVARLEARAEMASETVAEGLRARLSYLEAAGWLRCAHVWIHPRDLALRDSGITGSYAAAAVSDRLPAALPATAARESAFEVPPSDILVNDALRLARLWRRIAELHGWRPLADAGSLRETLRSLGCGTLDKAEIADWLGSIRALDRGPVLIRAGCAARDWLNRPGVEPHNPAGYFAAACLWREETAHRPIPLPFWSAPELYHHRLGLRIGLDWMTQFLECVTAAAQTGLRELARLREAETKRSDIRVTARSRLPDAFDAVLRAPVVTADSLAKTLQVTPRAALGLLLQLIAAGFVREATGRASWRAFVLCS
jgi:HTH DNA binding domain